MKAVLGLDGGGTKTFLRLAGLDKEVILEMEGGPSNICSCGVDTAEYNLTQLIRRARSSAPPNVEIISACIGSAGILTDQDALFFKKIIAKAAGTSKVLAKDDSVTALYANLEDEPGISLTSGTGSICRGKNRLGEIARVGGWGHIFSDEGSAYSMAVSALRRCLWSVDGRAPKTMLLDMIMEELGCDSAEKLTSVLYSDGRGKQPIAALSPLIDEAARRGDRAADEILEEASGELANMVLAAVRRLNMADETFCVYLSGSVLLKSEEMRNRFTKIITKACPHVSVMPSVRDAAWGAVHLAIREIQGK